MEEAKKQRGGARTGAGRHEVSAEVKRVSLTISVSPQSRDIIAVLRERGVKIGPAFDAMIAELAAAHGIHKL